MASSIRRRLGLLGVVTAAISFVAWIHGFLALDRPLHAGVLVVEGWLPREALDEVPRAFASGHYSHIIFVEYPDKLRLDAEILSNGRSLRTAVESAGARLTAVQIPIGAERRTYGGAEAVRQWLKKQNAPVSQVDVFTVGVHARKSQFLYQRALGPGVEVGVIAGTPLYYNPRLWFVSPQGIRLVARNLTGYVYSVAWIYADKLFE